MASALRDVLKLVTEFRTSRYRDPHRSHGLREPDRGDGRREVHRRREGRRNRRRDRGRLPARGMRAVRGAGQEGTASIRSSCWRRLPPTSASSRSAASASGYLYYVSLRGVTGAASPRFFGGQLENPARSAPPPSCRSAWGSASATRSRRAAWRRPPTQSSSEAASFRRSRRAAAEQAVSRVKAFLKPIREALDA